jgi:hypothetical protein
VAHLESVSRLRLNLVNVHFADDGGWRPLAKMFDQLQDRTFFTGYMRLDAAVRAVAHPARNTQRAGLLRRPSAKKDSLHPAGHMNVAADAGHHTTLMSGASSAFIPTTL